MRLLLYIIIRINIKAIFLGGFKDLIFFLKIPMGTRTISSILINNLGTHPQKVSPALL
jgi:hypothetical protein